MRSKLIKHICIKDCNLYNFDDINNVKAQCFKDEYYYIRYDYFTNEYEVYTEEDNDTSYVGIFETDYFSIPIIGKFEEYFVTVARWRDKQIDNILED